MPEAMDTLRHYQYPGNLRELESGVNKLITYAGRRVFPEDVRKLASFIRRLTVSGRRGEYGTDGKDGTNGRSQTVSVCSVFSLELLSTFGFL